jgi:phosphoglycolate phosphatase-like HAD superfamily hydrolase
MDLLKERKEVQARNANIQDLSSLIEWTKKESRLGNPALIKYASEVNNPVIDKTLVWSREVNRLIEELVFDIPPFPFFKESILKMIEHADTIVVSQTPLEALVREWEEHKIDNYVRVIAGQELGTKTEHLRYAAKGKYADNKILMIGDAPGDLDAARSNGVLFYPVNPGHEEASWERFYTESLDKFFNGKYKGEYENSLIEEFEKYLPEKPKWKA